MYESGAHTSALEFLEEINRMEHQEINLVSRVKSLELTVAQLESRINVMGIMEQERDHYRRLLSRSKSIIQNLSTENKMLRDKLAVRERLCNTSNGRRNVETGNLSICPKVCLTFTRRSNDVLVSSSHSVPDLHTFYQGAQWPQQQQQQQQQRQQYQQQPPPQQQQLQRAQQVQPRQFQPPQVQQPTPQLVAHAPVPGPQTVQPQVQGQRLQEDSGSQPNKQASPASSSYSLTCNPVVYPAGYKPDERRYSISSESFNPTQFQNTKFRNIPKSEEDAEAIRSTVTSNVLFKHLDSEQLDVVVAAMMPLELPEGTVVVKQGCFNLELEPDLY